MVHAIEKSSIEVFTFHSPAKFFNKSIDKHCFMRGHFGWCLEHQTTSVDTDGTYDVHHTFRDRNADGSEKITTKVMKERKCSHDDAREF